jgi:hypothetical protein
MALVGGGGRHKQEGTMEHAPDEERGAGSHQGGARTVEGIRERKSTMSYDRFGKRRVSSGAHGRGKTAAALRRKSNEGGDSSAQIR